MTNKDRSVPAVQLFSGGAAKGLVTQVQPRFMAESGYRIEGQFGAVGLMKDLLLAGKACDAVILTQAVVDQLSAAGHVVPESQRAVGIVRTGIAAKAGETAPEVATADLLKHTLLQAPAVYFPDPVKATAGIHFMQVLRGLGIEEALADRLRPFPNGAIAMAELSEKGETGSLGCTQVTEILYTAGVQLVAALPKELELATVYTAAITTSAVQVEAATRLIRMLTSANTAELRRAGGFE